jgi:hypothetical protein
MAYKLDAIFRMKPELRSSKVISIIKGRYDEKPAELWCVTLNYLRNN